MYTVPTLNTKQKARREYQLRAMSKNCVAVARLRLHVVYVSPPPRETWDSHSVVRVPVLHNIQQQNAALSAVCQLRRTGRLLIEFIGTSVRHYFDSSDRSHFSLQPQRLLISFLCKIILCQIVQTLNYRSNVVFCVRVLIIKQKTAHSDGKYEEVK